jgi:hypothetical protein
VAFSLAYAHVLKAAIGQAPPPNLRWTNKKTIRRTVVDLIRENLDTSTRFMPSR